MVTRSVAPPSPAFHRLFFDYPAPVLRDLLVGTLATAALLSGCGGAGGKASWQGARCLSRIPAAPLSVATPPALVMPTSRVMVDVQLHTASLLAELERQVPRKVVERRRQDIGAAGLLSFRVDRGTFGVALTGDELSVDVDLQGKAQLCKPIGILGCVDYASCEPGAHARAGMKLLLDSSFHLPPSQVAIPITRRCTLTALSLDVTGEVEGQATARANEIRARIDSSIPDMQTMARDLWKALGQSVPIGLGTCARVYPTGLVQAGPRKDGDAISLALGVEAEVRVESPCAPAQHSPPLPPPRIDRDILPGVELAVPVVLSWDEATRGMARSLAIAEITAGAEVVHITDARVSPYENGRVAIALTLAGDVCGEVSLVGTPAFDEHTSAFVFHDLTPADGEIERAKQLAPHLDLLSLARSIETTVHAVAPLDVGAMPERITRASRFLLKSMSPSGGPHDPDFDVLLESSKVTEVASTSDGLAATVVARGRVTVSVR